MQLLRNLPATILLALLMSVPVIAGTAGSFRGRIVEKPAGGAKEWIFVKGRNGTIRRVDISQAKVEYDEDVPPGQRTGTGREALVVGAEVRVTAEQGQDGEWRASRVEVLEESEPREDAPTERKL